MSRKKSQPTPVRAALQKESFLVDRVAHGLGAVAPAHRSCVAEEIRTAFADTLEIDGNLRAGHEQENRWDYLLGHRSLAGVIGLEPHSAKDDQVFTVIRKKQNARLQLRPHLRTGASVMEWYWMALEPV